MFTINDSEEEMADYIVLNDSKKRTRSVCRAVKQYQFFEEINKPNSLKCRFKTNKLLTAVKETKHTITTSEGKIIQEKLASKPINFQLSRRPEERRNPTNRCRRCGKFYQGEYCELNKKVYGIPKSPQEPCSSYTLPTMPQERSTYGDIITANTGTDAPEPQAITPADEQQEEHTPTAEETQSKNNTSEKLHRYLPHRSNAVLATVRVRPRGKINYRPH